LESNIKSLHEELKTNTYEPSAVRRVEIEKPDGGIRLLGIPTVKDRVVQQAVAKAERFMNRYELEYVVDMDLSKCFDTLDHELIISTVSERISDGRVLSLIRKFLKSGVMKDGNFENTDIGSPQGGLCKALHKAGSSVQYLQICFYTMSLINGWN